MAPRGSEVPVSITGKFPTNRDKAFLSVNDWLLGKEADDGAEGLWRIHDELYDLNTFIAKHPGGRDWLELTKGTDITEAFEVHHIRDTPEKLLPKFHVRRAKTPRNSLVSFKEDGFYNALKKKVQKNIRETGPTKQSKFLADGLALSCLILAILGAKFGLIYCILSGILLHMLTVTSHNFTHMRDNWRMYYFNFSLMSYRDWRVTHILSHHLFPNTILDMEISMCEPFFYYIPDPSKSFFKRFAPWLMSPFLLSGLFHSQFLNRMFGVLSRKLSFRMEELVGLSFPLAIYITSGSGLLDSFIAWTCVIVTASLVFGIVSLTAAHHHPDIYHEGDALVKDNDFGLLQLSAVRDRAEVVGNFFLVMISFGDHSLHHLFPTIDHHRLPALYPILRETCKEFGVDFKFYPAGELFTGMYKQMARNYCNAKIMIMNRKQSIEKDSGNHVM